MKFPRLFDDIDKDFKKIFDEWSELDKKFEEFRQNPSKISDVSHFSSHYENYYDSSDKNKSYSLSYKYDSNMDEPLIQIEGDIDEETINKFVSNAETRLSHSLEAPKRTFKHLLGGKPSKEPKKDSVKIKAPEERKYSLEMPGIGLKDISSKIEGRLLIVKGENGTIKYQKHIHLPFEPKTNPEITANNGLITITVKSK